MADADAISRSLARTWELVAGELDDGWTRTFGTASALVTNVPVPTLNGAWAMRADTPEEDIDAALTAVDVDYLPHCLEARPGGTAAARVAERREMVEGEDIPLMVTTTGVDVPAPDGLVLRELEPHEAHVHTEIAGPAFDSPPELLAGVITPRVVAIPELHCYVGEVDGEPVVTAISVVVDRAVGIFNVATPPDRRRRGYGAAATARALNDGLDAGADHGWLQSTESGHGIYERLGFETIEMWPCWLGL